MTTNKFAFTLAEMMVVLLILSLILAAFLPIMTTRATTSNSATSSIWKWADDKTNIYFGKENTPGAAIGTNNITSSDNTRFLLNTSSTVSGQSHILFKEDDITKGALKINTDGSILLSSNAGDSYNGQGITIGEGSIVSRSIKIGHNYSYTSTTGESTVSIGYDNEANQGYGVAIGESAKLLDWGAVALGANAFAEGNESIAIGYGAEAKNDYNVAIGAFSCNTVKGTHKTCIGYYSGPYGENEFASETDTKERIFLGGIPGGQATNGASVMEIHNTTSGTTVSSSYNIPDSAPVVVINGHLVVRGYTYIRTGSGEGLRRITGDSSELQGTYASPPGWSWPNMSDRRLKNILSENTDGLEKIRQLKTYNYTFKKDKHKYKHVGVIAQDLQKVLPNAVKKNKQGFLQVRTEDMFFALINSVKQLDVSISFIKAQVKDLFAKIDAQNTKIMALEAENQKFKEQNRLMESRLSKLEAKYK